MKLNFFLYKLENKISRFAIEKLTNLICGSMLLMLIVDVVLSAGQFQGSLFSILCFERNAIISELQIWRVLSFLMIYPGSVSVTLRDIVLTLLEIYIIYWSGNAVENYLGKARFNLYVLFGIVLTILSGFLTGFVDNSILYLSFFLVFAVLYPDTRVLIFFIIPVKVKWLGAFEGAILLLLLLFGPWYMRAEIIAVVIDFMIFFGYSTINKIKYDYREYKWRRRR